MFEHLPLRRRTATAVVAVLGLLLALLSLQAAPAHAAGKLTTTFTSADNGSWWMGTYVLHNDTDTDVTGWSLEFDLPAGVTIDTSYNGTVTTQGSHITAVNAHYNGTVPAHGTSAPNNFWFVAKGPIAEPTGCRINGDKCDGSPDAPPGAPGGLKQTDVTARTASLSWTAAAAGDFPVASYDVLAGGKVVGTATATTSTTVTGLTPATGYSFTVRARDTRGNTSAESAPLAVTTVDPATDTSPPTAPGALHATATDSSSVTLAWTASTDDQRVAAYDVYRDGRLATTVSGTTTTASVGGLSPSTSYTFTVKARDAADNASPASNALTVKTDDIVGKGNYAKVGYFVQWGIYGRQYFVKNLHDSGAADKLDIINYSFANIDPTNLTCLNGVTKGTTADPQDPDQGTGAGDADADYARPFSAAQSVDGVADDGWGTLRGNFNQLKKLKKLHPNLKIVVSLGGWTYSKYFSDVAATDASRKKFVSSCVDMYLKGNLPQYNGAGGPGTAAGIFDGFDIDWEWPGTGTGHPGNHYSPDDKANLTLLLAEFRKQMDALGGGHRLLTAFTPADPQKIGEGWELDKVFDSLDVANVQGYDFHGSGSDNSWEPDRTGHQANLYVDDQDPYDFHFSADTAIKAYTDAGVEPRKLTLGVPFYGRGWQGVTDGGAAGEWQAAQGAAPGQFAEEAGTRGYANLIGAFPTMTVHHDEQSISTYGFTGSQWWSFDDAWSIGKKTAYVKDQGLLGMMIWEMSGDTPQGTLLKAVDTGLS